MAPRRLPPQTQQRRQDGRVTMDKNPNRNDEVEESINQRVGRFLKQYSYSGEKSSKFAITSLVAAILPFLVIRLLAFGIHALRPEWFGSPLGAAVAIGIPILIILAVGFISGIVSIIRREKLWVLGLCGTLACLYFIVKL
jgi:hypothetical protein